MVNWKLKLIPKMISKHILNSFDHTIPINMAETVNLVWLVEERLITLKERQSSNAFVGILNVIWLIVM